jgi:microcystin-dependent protein
MSRDKQIQLRRDVASDWAAINPILASGEPGVETDTGKLKIGNGVAAWNSLPYFTQGEKGDKGDRGYQGTAGLKGDPGNDGAPGATGQTGLPGSTGAPGATGAKGDKGDKGDTGDRGVKGDKGDTGNTGATGATGAQGIQGVPGVKGDKGDTGDPGEGLPTGGTTGQQLVKLSNTDYDYDWETPAGAGDMLASVYDPTNVAADAFDQDNMADGTTNKNYTATEKTKLAGVEAGADVTDATNVAAAGAFMKAVDDTDDITVGATNKFATAAEKTKLGHITVTQAVDLDAIETNANNVPGIKTKTDFITVTQAVDLDTMESDIAGKQPLDSDLTSWAAIVRAAGFDTFAGTPSGANLAALLTSALPASKGGTGLTALSANVVSMLGAADYAAIKTLLALTIGTNVQAWDADLDAIAALGVTNDSIIQGKSGAWAKRTLAQLMTDLAALGTTFQPLDSDLTTIAGLTATTDNFMVANASAWASRTPAQAKTSLALVKGDVGLGNVDNTSDATKDAAAATLTNKTFDSTSPTAFFYPGMLMPSGRKTAPTGWLMCDGSAVSRSTYSGLFAAICESLGTFTVTIAAPGVFTLNSHGLNVGDAVYLTTTGALPTGLSQNTLYYVSTGVTANTFNLSTSRANAYAGTKITTTGSQSGVHTLRWCPYGLGDGSTTFTLPDFRGRTVAGADAMGGTAASRLTLADALGSYGNIGASGGEQRHTMTTGELVAHTHSLTANLFGSDFSGSTYGTGAFSMGTGGRNSGSQGSTTPFNLISPTVVANYMIKT